MDQFTVPKFIEQKPKIVGPLTFQQFVFVGIAVAISFFLYFTVPLMFFLAGSLTLVSLALGLAFGNAGGRPLTTMLKNFSVFIFAPKLYLWKNARAYYCWQKPPKGFIHANRNEIICRRHRIF